MSGRDRGTETDPQRDRPEPGIDPDADRRELGGDRPDRPEPGIDRPNRREPGIDRPDRPEPGIDPHLDVKIGLFFLAAVLGLAGIILGRTLPIFAAMVAIGAGLLLRFVRSPDGGDRAPRGEDRPSARDEAS